MPGQPRPSSQAGSGQLRQDRSTRCPGNPMLARAGDRPTIHHDERLGRRRGAPTVRRPVSSTGTLWRFPECASGSTVSMHPRRGSRAAKPEGGRYRCGRDATAALERLAAGGVRCHLQEGTGRYGRKIGTCYAGDGSDINALMVRLGHALANRKYSRKYVPEEPEARARRRGLHQGSLRPSMGLAPRPAASETLTSRAAFLAMAACDTGPRSAGPPRERRQARYRLRACGSGRCRDWSASSRAYPSIRRTPSRS